MKHWRRALFRWSSFEENVTVIERGGDRYRSFTSPEPFRRLPNSNGESRRVGRRDDISQNKCTRIIGLTMRQRDAMGANFLNYRKQFVLLSSFSSQIPTKLLDNSGAAESLVAIKLGILAQGRFENKCLKRGIRHE